MTDHAASRLPTDLLVRLTTIAAADTSLEAALDRVVAVVDEALPGVDAVSITLLRGEEEFTAAYSDDLALRLDKLQYSLGRGPCVEAAQSGTVVEIPDMAADVRWPDYTPQAHAEGAGSSLSLPLPMQTDLLGALNVYSTASHAFDDSLRGLGIAVASCVAVACVNHETYTAALGYGEQMRLAMEFRAAIEQAKGMIMAQNRCTPDEAFEILRRASMGRNVKLRDIALQMVENAPS
jgi:GAF domain-containing protein